MAAYPELIAISNRTARTLSGKRRSLPIIQINEAPNTDDQHCAVKCGRLLKSCVMQILRARLRRVRGRMRTGRRTTSTTPGASSTHCCGPRWC